MLQVMDRGIGRGRHIDLTTSSQLSLEDDARFIYGTTSVCRSIFGTSTNLVLSD